MADSPPGAAVVGTGFIGPVHVEALRRLGVPVRGVLGSTPAKGAEAARTLGLPRAYADLGELLADPAVAVVHLASPNRLHAGQCRAALAAGKHVVCEKPLAPTAAECAELAALAAASPLVTAVNYNVRFYPLVLDARDRVRRGQVGRLFHVTGSYLQDWLLKPTDYNWRVDAAAGGDLRAVADIGTHWLDTVAFVVGEPVEAVFADLRTVHPTRTKPSGGRETFSSAAAAGVEVPVTTEDCGSVLLRFRGGAKGVLTVSQVCAGRKNRLTFDIAGAEASLAWDSEEPNTLWVGRRETVEAVTRDPATLGETARGFSDYPAGHAEGFPDTFKQLYKAVYADVRRVQAGGAKSAEPVYATFADGLREAQLCEAVLRSHRDERWVSVP